LVCISTAGLRSHDRDTCPTKAPKFTLWPFKETACLETIAREDLGWLTTHWCHLIPQGPPEVKRESQGWLFLYYPVTERTLGKVLSSP
jgi:hypothetical protein